VEVLQRLGADTRPEQVRPLSEMIADVDLRARVSELEGERHTLQRQLSNLMRSGAGLTYPSCWMTTPDNHTEYMFDVIIRDDGLTVKDATPSRADDPSWQLVQSFPRNALIGETLFVQATAKLFAWSQEKKCRFYTIIRDGTGANSKERYKQLRSIVEGHFYPLHLPLSAPPRRPPRSQNPQSAPKSLQPAAIGGPHVPIPLQR
jgi:hypothetical protein